MATETAVNLKSLITLREQRKFNWVLLTLLIIVGIGLALQQLQLL